MSTKHTPGPWVANQTQYADGSIGIGPVNVKEDVARALHTANANLIAAAPEMLEALKMALSNIPRPTMQDKDCAERLATLAHIQDVIDKATGG
jgi:hypothetical protein